MAAISYAFCDWVLERIKTNLSGKLSSDLVIDERAGGLGQKIAKAVNKGIGACVVVGVGDITPQGSGADDTQCEVAVNIGILHNSVLKTDFDSRLFAEELYRKFAGAEYERPPSMAVNVRAGQLTTQGEDKKIHTFTVSYLRVLKGV